MRVVLAINLCATLLVFAVSNDFLIANSYLFYGFQTATLFPYLLKRARYIKNVFMPSLFALIYYLISLTLGSFLVPRNYGWGKTYVNIVWQIENYHVIVSYLMLSCIVLFVTSLFFIRKLENQPHELLPSIGVAAQGSDVVAMVAGGVCVAFVGAVAYLDFYGAFSVELAILIAHLSRLSSRRAWYRFVFYVAYLTALLAFNFDDKREIAIALFTMIFLEVYFGNHRLDLSTTKLLLYSLGFTTFFALIFTASILRGYGGFGATTVSGALEYLPEYVTSDIVVDVATDNLELNYSYGAAVTSIESTVSKVLPMQYGKSLLKIALLPVSRDVYPDKPESVMQLYSRKVFPEFWSFDGSLPVFVPSEMFVNFGYAGLIASALIWTALNSIFVAAHTSRRNSLAFLSSIFIVGSVLMFARGSGLELFLSYYLISIPIFVVVALCCGRLRVRWGAPQLDARA